jgi:hypothetical protein
MDNLIVLYFRHVLNLLKTLLWLLLLVRLLQQVVQVVHGCCQLLNL